MKFRSCGTNSTTRRELANLRDEIGSIGHEFRASRRSSKPSVSTAIPMRGSTERRASEPAMQGVKIMPSEHSNIA